MSTTAGFGNKIVHPKNKTATKNITTTGTSSLASGAT
jgi:hypothetical protein